MPGPVAAIAGAAIAGGVAQAAGARSSARALSNSADQQAALSREQMQRIDAAYGQQRNVLDAVLASQRADANGLTGVLGANNQAALDSTIGQAVDVFRRNNALAEGAAQREQANFTRARDDAMGFAQGAFDREGVQGREARDAAIAAADDAFTRDRAGFTSARDAILGRGQAGFDAEMGLARDARDIGRADADSALSRQRSDLNRGLRDGLADLSPFADSGRNALAALNFEMGLGAAPEGFQGLAMSPAARFALEQGRDVTEAGAAARGGLQSGATLEAMERLRMGMAAQDRETQMDRLMGLGGMGQNAASQMAALRGSTASQLAGVTGDHRNALLGLESNFADRGINANQALTGLTAGAQQGFADRMAGASQAQADRLTNAQNAYTDRFNASSRALSGAQIGAGDLFARNMFQSSQMARDAQTAASTGLGQSAANAFNNFYNGQNTAATMRADMLNTALSNYATGQGNAAALFGQGSQQASMMGANALANLGNAQAAGRIGVGNAISDGFNNAIGGWQMSQLLQRQMGV